MLKATAAEATCRRLASDAMARSKTICDRVSARDAMPRRRKNTVLVHNMPAHNLLVKHDAGARKHDRSLMRARVCVSVGGWVIRYGECV